MRPGGRALALALLIVLAIVSGGEVLAQADERPVLLQADEISYDQARGIVVATGRVEISVDDRILLADRVSYDERADTVAATGNVSILDPNGDVFFADQVELSNRLRDGFLTSFRALLADRSRFAAAGARRTGGNRTEMFKVVYSACELVPGRPHRAPLWQFKAVKIVHNQRAQRINYQDAVLEVLGVPVAYTPFFSHPDPTVKRQSGFLAPSYGSSTALGLMLEVPYYSIIAPHRDATFAPLFTSKEGVVLGGEYRQRTERGNFDISGSVTRPERRDDNNQLVGGRQTRGHVFSKARSALDDTWRWGFDVRRSTDDTYLRRYELSTEDTLTSNAFIKGFRGRNYASANVYSFQGLREDDDPGQTPLVLPLAEFHHRGEPGHLGQLLNLDSSLLVTERNEGTDTRRLSLDGGWMLPYTSPVGERYTLSASVRGDLYWVTDVAAAGGGTKDNFTGRLFPQVGLDWRYALIRPGERVSQTVEPVVMAILAPNGGNPGDIPNEDSLSFEFDHANLFRAKRFPGLDRVEGGARVNYGLRWSAHGSAGGSAAAVIGQVLRLREDDTFADKTGLEDKRSDYVGAVNVAPADYLGYTHRFRLDRDSLSIRRNEIDLSAGPAFFKINLSYALLSRELTADEFGSREELTTSASARITPYWTATAKSRHDLTEGGGTLKYGFGMTYQDECLTFLVDFERNFTSDRDVQPSTSISFRVKLKHIG